MCRWSTDWSYIKHVRTYWTETLPQTWWLKYYARNVQSCRGKQWHVWTCCRGMQPKLSNMVFWPNACCYFGCPITGSGVNSLLYFGSFWVLGTMRRTIRLVITIDEVDPCVHWCKNETLQFCNHSRLDLAIRIRRVQIFVHKYQLYSWPKRNLPCLDNLKPNNWLHFLALFLSAIGFPLFGEINTLAMAGWVHLLGGDWGVAHSRAEPAGDVGWWWFVTHSLVTVTT